MTGGKEKRSGKARQKSQPRKLTFKQQRFCDAYVNICPGNATEAARQAGYKGNSATLGAVGGENLKKPLVAELIASLERLNKEDTQDEREKTAQFLADARDNEAVPWRDRVSACKALAEIRGWKQQTIVLETAQRQRELDQAALEVARRAALAVYDTRALPPALPVEATVKQAQTPAKPGG